MGEIYSINGPVVRLRGDAGFAMTEMVLVGPGRLIGEVISISSGFTTIQVYESTTGLAPGDIVEGTGAPLSVTLGPGILGNIFDGIQRPLIEIKKLSGMYIKEGVEIPSLDTAKKWDVSLRAREGDEISQGAIYAVCPETEMIEHRCTVPPGLSGRVIFAAPDGQYSINDEIIKIQDENGKSHSLTLSRKWSIRTPRPTTGRLPGRVPLITGQRIIDAVFPLAKGGTAAIPGGFGTGKTMLQHQLAKWCDADIIIYVGCGERGNEMTQVLREFSELVDPRSGKSLLGRTALIANTSNMPVAAREASIYTGITLAEYYRDMGYHVALMADSTSRWAEALREISGRLEEMPAEEGFPAYLPSRLSRFYERAGLVKTLCGSEGSVSIIGAVSPQGADFSEPVTQNTKRFVRCFWALDKSLAYSRHYPAINWDDSYSEYTAELADWYEEHTDSEFAQCRQSLLNILHEEKRLMEIVKLIGADVLPDDQKLVLEAARLVRVGFLQQNAFHSEDTFVPLQKQYEMMKLILFTYNKLRELLKKGALYSDIIKTEIFGRIVKMKYEVPSDGTFDEYYKMIDEVLKSQQFQISE